MTIPALPHRTPLRDAYRLNAVQIPALRALGLGTLSVCVLFYKLLVDHTFTWSGYLEFASVMALYCAGSWLALRWAYAKRRRVDLGFVLLNVDLFFFLYAIYNAGADNSFLFFVLVMRVSDQGFSGTRRMFFFAHLTAAIYALFVVYLGLVEQRPVDWGLQVAKLIFIYGMNLYMWQRRHVRARWFAKGLPRAPALEAA